MNMNETKLQESATAVANAAVSFTVAQGTASSRGKSLWTLQSEAFADCETVDDVSAMITACCDKIVHRDAKIVMRARNRVQSYGSVIRDAIANGIPVAGQSRNAIQKAVKAATATDDTKAADAAKVNAATLGKSTDSATQECVRLLVTLATFHADKLPEVCDYLSAIVADCDKVKDNDKVQDSGTLPDVQDEAVAEQSANG